MDYLQTIALAIVQGVTEFLPVSSDGHLTLVPLLLGWPSFGLAFDVALHLGTLLATVVYFREDLVRILSALFSKDAARAHDKRTGWLIALATMVSAVVALILESTIVDIGGAEPVKLARFVGVFLFVTSISLVAAEIIARYRERKGLTRVGEASELTWGKAALIGLAQGLAPFQGVSRSGMTIATGLGVGMDREEAARFSFLLSVPIVFAAVMKKLVIDVALSGDAGAVFAAVGFGPVLAGIAVTAVVGYFALQWLLPFVRKHSLVWFAVYTTIVGIALIVWSFV